MDNDSHNQVMFLLGQVDGGIKGINARLDKINGRLDRHDTKIEDLDKAKSEQTGSVKIIAGIWGVTSSVIIGIITWLITKHG